MGITRKALSVVLGSLFIIFAGLTVIRFDAANNNCVQPLQDAPEIKLLHVAAKLTSFYDTYNTWFAEKWKCKTGQTVSIVQSYGSSGDQMRKMIQGEISPEIISMSNPAEIDAIAKGTGMVSLSWREDFPYESSPYYTTLVFAVRKGNPRNIKNWEDLTASNLTINVSNPKTCGGGRWVYTGVLGHGMDASAPLHDRTKEYLARFYANVPVLYADQGNSIDAFVLDNVGDVLVTYEAAILREAKRNDTSIEMVLPERTVEIGMPIALAIKTTEENGTTDIARAYINGIYEPEVQRLIAADLIRPRISASEDLAEFPVLDLYARAAVFPDSTTENAHLQDGGVFDSLKKR